MSRLADRKQDYDNIKIPEELHRRVEQEIEKLRAREKMIQLSHRKRWFRNTAAAAAAVCVVLPQR